MIPQYPNDIIIVNFGIERIFYGGINLKRGLLGGRVTAIALLLAAVFLAGCAKIPEPDGPDDSLLIGVINLEARGYREKSDMRIDGEHSRNITITFCDVITGKEYKVKTGEAGLFWSNEIPTGNYYLKTLHFELERDNYKYWIRRGFSSATLPVRPGRVTNLGALLWYSDAEKEEERIRQVKTPEQLRNELQRKFPESAWYEREWISIKF
ncbi:MAG: hypothetical protein GX085_04910 [Firmicutes bacterium]|nr:hypothetical protein [Bacillota bacterium]